MKRILVVSDNHFQAQPLTDILNRHGDVDYFVHCGDSQWQVDEQLLSGFIAVRGNNDFARFPLEEVVSIEGYNVLVVHGHMQDVFNYGDHPNVRGTEQLVTYAQTLAADVIFYGHTHVPESHTDRDVFILNPGSINFPRGLNFHTPTYAIVTLEDETISARFYDANTGADVSDKI